MIAGVVGLGLIGGSFAKAYAKEGHTVYGYDVDHSMLAFAKISGDVQEELTKENIRDCDIVLICVYPKAAVDYMKEMGPYIGEKPLVIDCCGTKREVFTEGIRIAKECGFTYLGGHPMAGTQYSGFKYAKANMFKGAPMVLVPEDNNDILLLSRAKELLAPAGFAKISNTTADEHDKVIAFTSQLAHVVSNAYIKSPTAIGHKGFSAGSYKDMTRVAWLNPEMWAELFLENKDNLISELDILVGFLSQYRDALETEDKEELIRLLAEGRARKEEVDGR